MPEFNGPIPGENYTGDVNNYPWHRPPDKGDFVSTVEHLVERVGSPKGTGFVITALELGDTITDVVTGLLRVGVGKGRFSIDNAVLAAGPMAKHIEVLAKKAGIDYERGWSERPDILTKEKLEAYGVGRSSDKPSETKTDPAEDAPDAKPDGGIMAAPEGTAPKDTQMQMLGYGEEESNQ
jgi:hypothetical protein